MAANISNINGQSCGADSGNWHFVNNQTNGATGGTLTATFSSGQVCVVGPSKVLNSTMHFDCNGYSGELLSASTGSVPGRLVLSDYTCDDTKECDPKVEVCK